MKKICFFLMTALVLSFLTSAKEIVLQNGAGYSGCVDTYLTEVKDNNFGTSTKLILEGKS